MTTDRKEIYRCATCGGMVEVLHSGALMQCCGKPMTLLKGNISDGAAVEKHVPMVEAIEGGYFVTVGGSDDHPMQPNHYVEWIELITPSRVMRKELKPGEKPEVVFRTRCKWVCARAYCNLHGLWKG